MKTFNNDEDKFLIIIIIFNNTYTHRILWLRPLDPFFHNLNLMNPGIVFLKYQERKYKLMENYGHSVHLAHQLTSFFAH